MVDGLQRHRDAYGASYILEIELSGHPRPTNAVDREHLSALQGAGDGAIEAGEWDEARQHLETALQAAEAEYGRQHLYYAQAQAAYGRLMPTTGAIDAAYANLDSCHTWDESGIHHKGKG